MIVARQADSLTEEQVSEFKEAFSLFVCFPRLFPVFQAVSSAYLAAGRATEILRSTNLIIPCNRTKMAMVSTHRHFESPFPTTYPPITAARPSNAQHRKLGYMLAHAAAGAAAAADAAAACQHCGAERLNGY